MDRVEEINTWKVSQSWLSPVQTWRDFQAVARLTETEAKLAALLEQEEGGEGDYQGFAAFLPIIQAALPIVLQVLQVEK